MTLFEHSSFAAYISKGLFLHRLQLIVSTLTTSDTNLNGLISESQKFRPKKFDKINKQFEIITLGWFIFTCGGGSVPGQGM